MMCARIPSGLLLSSLLFTLAVSGCILADEGPGGPGDGPAAQDGQDGRPEQHAIGGNETQVETFEGHITYSVNWPGVHTNSEGEIAMIVEPALGATGFVVELTWEPSTELSRDLDLVVFDAVLTQAVIFPPLPEPREPTARAAGESPLRIELPAEEVQMPFGAVARATSDLDVGPVGLAVEQPFTLTVATLFEDPFEGNWTSSG